MSDAAVLIVGAGMGRRLHGDRPKAFVEIAGKPLLAWTTLRAASAAAVSRIIMVVPEGYEREVEAFVAEEAVLSEKVTSVVTGGATRQGSVQRGLAALAVEPPVVVCHDAARPFASREVFHAAVSAVAQADVDGIVPVLRVAETVSRVRNGVLVGNEDRSELALAQTPQAFVAAALMEAHRRAAAEGAEFTDDAGLVAWAGFTVRTIEGDPANFKVTTREDLQRARALLGTEEPAEPVIGTRAGASERE